MSAPIFPKYFYNDKIKIKGKFQTPAEFEDFSYKDFLLKDGIRTVSYYPEIELKDRQGGFYANILKIKEVLRKTNKKILPSPASEVLGAMILGDKGLLTQDIKDGFSKTGLSHILAISGMHIAIIVGIFISILNRTKLKDKTFYIISTFLVFYVLFRLWAKHTIHFSTIWQENVNTPINNINYYNYQ